MKLVKCLDCGHLEYRKIREDELVYCRKCVPEVPKTGPLPQVGIVEWRAAA